MSEIIDRVVLGLRRFTGTNLERGAPGHLVLGGVLHQVHVQPHKVSEEEIPFCLDFIALATNCPRVNISHSQGKAPSQIDIFPAHSSSFLVTS